MAEVPAHRMERSPSTEKSDEWKNKPSLGHRSGVNEVVIGVAVKII